MTELRTILLSFSACAGVLAAQDAPPVLAVPALPAEAFRVALHDDPDEPGDALWAAGDAYKVRIAEDVEVHPLLGAFAPRSLPLRWQTTAIAVGGQALPQTATPVRRHGDWRCELDHGAVVEAYDVRPDGVEQTFVLRAPLGAGDLVVRGRVATALRRQPVAAAHQALAFTDADGRTILTYGAATAIDAAGRRAPMTTSFDGAHVELRLSGTWLAQAAYPVVVDPLIATGDVVTHLTEGTIGGLGVACSDQDPRRLLVVYHRAFSAGDRDVFGYSCAAGFTNPSRVFSRTGSFDDHDPSAAYHSASNRWVVAFERKWSTGRNVHVYLHARDSSSENSGTTLSVPLVANEDAGNPAVGGTRRASPSPYALLAYESDRGATIPEVVTIAIDVAAGQFVGAPDHVGSGAASLTQMRGNPSVSPVGAFNTTGWVVVFEEWSLATSTSIQASRYDSQAAKVGSAVLVASVTGSHALAPRIAGTGTDFALTYGRRALASGSPVTVLSARRLTWPIGQAPVLGSIRTLDTGGGATAEEFSNGTIAYDWHAGSQWVATYLSTTTTAAGTTTRGHVLRLGATCGIVESAQTDATLGRVTGIAGTYDWVSDLFPTAYATNQTGPTRNVIRGSTFRYPTGAASTPYGSSCSIATVGSTRPLAGNEHFTVSASGLNQAQSVGVLLLAPMATQFSLAGFGMAGCNLLVGPFDLVQLPVAGTSGFLSQRLPLPDHPVLRGTFYCQFAYLDGNANPLGVRTTRGLQVSVQ